MGSVLGGKIPGRTWQPGFIGLWLENLMEQEAWWCSPWNCSISDMTETTEQHASQNAAQPEGRAFDEKQEDQIPRGSQKADLLRSAFAASELYKKLSVQKGKCWM